MSRTFHKERPRATLCYRCHKKPRTNGQGYCRDCRNKYERERKRRVAEELAILRQRFSGARA